MPPLSEPAHPASAHDEPHGPAPAPPGGIVGEAPTTAPWLRRQWHRLLVTDPGLQRSYLAGRITLSVAIALAVALPASDAAGQSPVVGMLAVAVAMAVTPGITGPTPRAQLVAAARTWGMASLSTAAGAALAVHAPAGHVGIVAAMTVGGWLTRRGVRWISLGMAAFMPYAFTLFTRATIAQLPWLLGAVALGVAVPLLVRMLALRDPPERRLTRLLLALRARTAPLVAYGVSGATGTPYTPAPPSARRADAADDAARAAVRVDEVVLQLHDLVDQRPDLVGAERAFRRDLFGVVTLCHLMALRAEPGADESLTALTLPPGDPPERLARRLASLEARGAGRMAEAIGGIGGDDAESGEDAAEEALDEATGAHRAVPADEAARLDPAGRAAVQVAVAGAAAVVVGVLVSPERWYWVPMSAFFVFVNTTSRGATMRRAAERTIGTAAGLAGGIVAGYLLAGMRGFEVALLFPLIFAGYWLLQVSYAAMIASMTILLVLALDLIGVLTPELLVARLVDTMIGAALGAASAYLVLPARTRGVLDDAFRDYVVALDDLLATLPEAGRHDHHVLDTARTLDRATGALRTAVEAVATSVPGRRSRALRQELLLALTARFWVHRAAARLVFHAGAAEAIGVADCVAGVRDRIGRLLGSDAVEPMRRGACAGPDVAALARADTVLGQLARARAAAA